jgi:carbon monoxide dehydrogenase subunit G
MALIIQSSFRTEAPIDVVWRVLTNIEVAAPCFPGAQLGEKQEDGTYKGSFNIKLGPMSFLFAGKFGFVSLDPQTHHAKINASGSDTKGRGGAQALVDVQLTQEAAHTLVDIVSDATLSGGVAQFGRGTGMIQALTQQLIDQFARQLSVVIAQDLAAIPDQSAVQSLPPSQPSLAMGALLWHSLKDWLRGLLKKQA